MKFKKTKLIPKRLNVNFLVNDKIIIDARYDVDCKDGTFSNIIPSTLFKKITKPKQFQKMFEIKTNLSTSDISETADEEVLIAKTFRNSVPSKFSKPIKSILKKPNSKKVIKRVQFNFQNVYCN